MGLYRRRISLYGGRWRFGGFQIDRQCEPRGISGGSRFGLPCRRTAPGIRHCPVAEGATNRDSGQHHHSVLGDDDYLFRELDRRGLAHGHLFQRRPGPLQHPELSRSSPLSALARDSATARRLSLWRHCLSHRAFAALRLASIHLQGVDLSSAGSRAN